MCNITKEMKLTHITLNDHIAYMFMHHNIKFTKFLYVNGQRNLLSTTFQPTLDFNIVPYGTNFSNSNKFCH